MKTRLALTMEDAKIIAAAAEEEARRNGWAVTIAVCDGGGHLLWLQRMDGAPLMSAQIAPGKAHTCVVARKPSKALEDMINNGRVAALSMPVLPLEGGEMILIEDDVIGGVGVSGVLSAQDAQVARAGIAALAGAVGPAQSGRGGSPERQALGVEIEVERPEVQRRSVG